MSDTQEKKKSSQIAGIIISIVLLGILAGVGYTIYSFIKEQQRQEDLQSTQQESDVRVIGVFDVKKKIDSDESFRLIDLRAAEDYDEEHIVGSENIPINEFRNGAYKSLPLNETIVLSCYGEGCPFSREGAELLLENGYTDVYDMAAGMIGWKTAGLPVIESKAENNVNQFKVGTITATQLQTLLADPDQAPQLFLLDIRDTDAFSAQHIEGSINIERTKIEQRRRDIPIDKRVIIIADDQKEAQEVGATLFDLNVLSIFELEGGIETWLTVTSSAPEPEASPTPST